VSCGAIDDCLRRLGYDGIARRKPVGGLVRADLAARDDLYIVPHLVEVEVLGALRGMVAGGQIESHRMGQFLRTFPHSLRSGGLIPNCCTAFGNSGTISLPTTRCISLWRRKPARCSIRQIKG
jgi:hypothetical protein